jgi:lipopolysaccharide/colanic/teichoic acid biosynthesis glycosyltransferase
MTLTQQSRATDPILRKTAVPVRRIIDLIVSGAGLIVLAPLLALVAVAIWLEGGRPILFSQVRLGLLGRHFRIYKFRKFHKRIATAGCGVTTSGDVRLSALGRFLGRTKLDELPQLWNILIGDMSIVGPRPESLHFADCITRDYRGVLAYKPGIFGPNQVYFRDEGSLFPEACDPEQFYREVLFPIKANIDLAYFPNRTFVSDVGWIVRSVLVIFGVRLFPRKFNATLARWLDQQDPQQPATQVSLLETRKEHLPQKA